MYKETKALHSKGEEEAVSSCIETSQVELETFAGKVFVEWDPEASVTPLAQLSFFIEFLKIGRRFEPWVESCPLQYSSNNAPEKIDVLGSIFLSVLSGHTRFAHITTLVSDCVNAKLLGMNKIVSDDSARRGLKKIDEARGVDWMQDHLKRCYEPLLGTPWILDCDVTVKPLYGHQEGAVVGYNPHKRGRPSHTYHSYMIGNLRLILDVEVQPGNQTAASHSMPGLLDLVRRLDRSMWPEFIRGDCDWGSDSVMGQLEDEGLNYLFKLKKHKKVKELIYKAHNEPGWQLFKDNWEAKADVLEFGKDRIERRVILVRRRIQNDKFIVAEDTRAPRQLSIATIEEPENFKLYEYSVLVTNLEDELVSIVQHYRDRADCENVFDEIKNQWGWGGFTTKDIKTSQLMSRIIALIYNWWNLFVRLVNEDGYIEAIKSRPLLLTGVGRLTESGRQKRLVITSQHAWSSKAQEQLSRVSRLFSVWKADAPQLTDCANWGRIITTIVLQFAEMKGVGPPKLAGT